MSEQATPTTHPHFCACALTIDKFDFADQQSGWSGVDASADVSRHRMLEGDLYEARWRVPYVILDHVTEVGGSCGVGVRHPVQTEFNVDWREQSTTKFYQKIKTKD